MLLTYMNLNPTMRDLKNKHAVSRAEESGMREVRLYLQVLSGQTSIIDVFKLSEGKKGVEGLPLVSVKQWPSK